ncbi:O-antigen ligase [Bacillus sp. MRMR6]|uniref:O-antigen ligase family protein n=1 Tax=Bacillus sp. MRMR6 TaxID=1928617 RepID=UPI0009536959|nr:hypothetical protein [Bacillus sp. MRMR6]OLS40006.1 hypothetical protein BTR25_10975 [Bacillus sp. MRMR6]
MKKITLLLFTMIFLSASIVLMGSQYRPLTPELIMTRYMLISIGFSILIFIYFINGGIKKVRFSSFLAFYIFILWSLFSLSVLVSETLNNEFPIQGLFFLLIVPFIYFIVMPFVTKKGGFVIHYALFASNFLYILLSYVLRPVDSLPYMGITANPNGFGQIAAIACISGFIILITIPKQKRWTKLLLIAALLLSLGSVILSSSRTSFVVVAFIIFIITVYFLVARGNFKPLLSLVTLGVIAWLSPLREVFLAGLVDKFAEYYQNGNILNGRTGTWGIVMRDARLFGNGEDYFDHFFEGAHNSIINILGVYGIIPALLLTTFLVALMVQAFLFAFRNKKDTLAVFPFVIIVTFTLFSMTEAMFGLIGNGITVAFYLVTGYILFYGCRAEPKAKVKAPVVLQPHIKNTTLN